MSLAGRHALVCGASAGIGQSSAIALAQLGASITALARSEDKLKALVPVLEKAGAERASYVVADMDDRPALRKTVEKILADSGPVHVLINNSGGPASGPILQASEDDFLKAFGRHVLAFQLLTQLTLPGMREAGYGRIINIVSTSVREPIAGLGVSNTTRAAVGGWAKSVSKELPPGVTINNVLPGFTATERLDALKQATSKRLGKTPEQVEADWLATVPEGRLGRPEELGEVIAFLASPAASFIRGVSLPVDGGRMQSI